MEIFLNVKIGNLKSTRNLRNSHNTQYNGQVHLAEEDNMSNTISTKYPNPAWDNKDDKAESNPFDSTVKCHRCQGLLVHEFCSDLQDGTGEIGFWALRCLQCGELLDPLILRHRTSKPHPVLTGRSRQKLPMALS